MPLSQYDIYSFYRSLPAPLRSVLDAGYYLVPESMKRSRSLKAYLAEYRETQWYTQEQLHEYQTQRLRTLLTYAARAVPFYKELIDSSALEAGESEPWLVLRQLPVVDKAFLKNRMGDFSAASFPQERKYEVTTSGSTGSFFKFPQTKEAFERQEALTLRYLDWFGIQRRWRHAIFYRAIMKHPKSDYGGPPYERFRNRLFLSQFHTDDAGLAYYVEMLNDFQPEYFTLFPTTALMLTRHCKKFGTATFKPKVIMCYSENLYEHHRQEIEEFWGCKVFNRYGASEGCVSAGDCEHQHLHLASELGATELLGKDDRPLPLGTEGRVVVTGFHTEVFPFIRYDTGDRGVLSGSPCACGRMLPTLDYVDGRGDDMIYTKDGKCVAALRDFAIDTAGIRLMQIIQEKKGSAVINIVPEKDYSDEAIQQIQENIDERLGAGHLDVTFRIVEDVERSPSGKIRLVISRLPE
ncbi:MAG: hypothetical protein CL946_09965 [Ectothiorhodospiraceae bacterium]|nr:hypothetical protein [Ectothiorhodospiraceae bacterium]